MLAGIGPDHLAESDRLTRLVRLYLTDRARGRQGVIEAERDELERRATGTLTSTEREHVRSALIKIIAQFADQSPPADPEPPPAAPRPPTPGA